MEITIPLPNLDSEVNTYTGLKSYLKQLETAVHYAQKSVENAEKEGIEVSEDASIDFEHPALDQEDRDSMYDELQSVSLHINLQ